MLILFKTKAIEWFGINDFFLDKPFQKRTPDQHKPTAAVLNPAAIQLIENLATLTPSNVEKTRLLIRIGAKSTTDLWYTGLGPVPPFKDAVLISDYDLKILDLVANLTGCQFSLGLSMRSSDISQNHIDTFVQAIRATITPSNIQSFELGNEPDHYVKNSLRPNGTYSPAVFFKENQDMVTYTSNLYPGAKFTGPSHAFSWDEDGTLNKFITQFAGQMTYFSYHKYELRGCASSNSLSSLMSQPKDAASYKIYSSAKDTLQATGKPGKIIWNEAGTASCGGVEGISNAFASGLWTLDSGFLTSTIGVDHQLLSGTPQALYGPIRRNKLSFTVEATYYGMFLFKLANKGDAVTVYQQPFSGGGNTKIYVSNNSENMKTITIINKNMKSSASSLTLNFKVDPAIFKFATSLVMSSPGGAADITAKTTIGGLSFDTVTGLLSIGTSTEAKVPVSEGAFSVTVEPETAMAIRISNTEYKFMDDIKLIKHIFAVNESDTTSVTGIKGPSAGTTVDANNTGSKSGALTNSFGLLS
ncbi:hypothetical protein HK099_001472, partial [Clydaea vesicula]